MTKFNLAAGFSARGCKEVLAAAFLVFLSLAVLTIWRADREKIVTDQPAAATASPTGTGLRLSCWEGQNLAGSLEISTLSLTPKRWGPFKLGDHQDIQARECRLILASSDLSSVLQDMGATLLLMKRGNNPSQFNDEQGGKAPGGHLTLINLPPKIVVDSLSCYINFPQGPIVAIKADRAEIAPPQPQLIMQGQVLILSSSHALLAGDRFKWNLKEGIIETDSRFTLTTNKNQLNGATGRFSLAGGAIKKIESPKIISPSVSPSAADAVSAPFDMSLWGKMTPSSGALSPG
jgi:hypothetical protein